MFFYLGSSQISKVHYIPPLTANKITGGGGSVPEDQFIYLSTPSTDNVTVTITPLNGDAPTIYTLLSNSNPIRYDIGSGGETQLFVDHDTTGGTVALKAGFLIEADCPIYTSVRYNAGAQAGALVSKGDASLGTHFRAGMMTMGTKETENSQGTSLSFVSVMATKDNTIVSFELPNAVSATTISNFTYLGPFTKTLNQYESIILAINYPSGNDIGEARNSLIGALIKSVTIAGVEDKTKPIVVNVGSSSGTFSSNGGGHDHGIDQIVGLDRVGHEYIFVKGNGQNNTNGGELETPLIVGAVNNTEIFINDDTNPIVTINAGDYYLISSTRYSTQDQGATMYVRTQDKNHPVFAYQGIGGSGTSEANQGMFFVPPLDEEANDDVNNVPEIDFIGNDQYDDQAGVSIVTKNTATITINDTNGDYDISSLTPITVLGNSDYKAYSVTDLAGNVKVTSDSELYLAYFNTSGAATSGGFYAGFATPPNAELNLGINSLGNCLQIDDQGNVIGSNITLQITNSSGFNSWVWQIKDASGNFIVAPGASENTETYIPEKEGEYRLKGVINCINFDQYSGIIPISICPADSDNDGVIDNLDLDLDNDGIYNSVESAGNLNVDLSNIASPVFKDSNNNVVNISVQITTDGSDNDNKISGSATGELQFELAPSANHILSFEIKNTLEPLNYKFTGKPETITAGDYFEIRVLPSTRNVTLLDPDDQLLIDTNYDGETFSSGITTYTSNLIRFKYRADTTLPSYQFLAYDVEGFKISSGADETSSVSLFTGKLEVVDYKINSDDNTANADALYDYYDPDSDGDGCNDVIEAGWIYPGFLGDPDSDGILGTSPLNTNTPGVIDDRGLVVTHKTAGGYEIDPKKNTAGNYLFQTPSDPVGIQTQPQSTSGCEGNTIEFEVTASSSSQTTIYYQWKFYNLIDKDWENISDGGSYSGATTSKLTITNITTAMDGRYRVFVNDDEYLCDIGSDSNISLTVNESPENPIVSQIQTFCQTDTPKVSNLVASNDGATLTLYWYDSVNATTPLDSTTPLEHNKFYYAEFIDNEGCISSGRTESKAYISNPILNASNEVVCVGDTTKLTIENIAKTAADFSAENNLIFITNNGEPVTWDTSFGKTYFMIQAGTGQTGFSPIDWTTAKQITDNYNSGDSSSSARMYVILDADMETTVWNGLNSMGLTGNDGIYFWLGLYQDLNDPEYAEPGNAAQNYAGWKWVNGAYLKDTYVNWWTDEPNDAGSEHYGQFEFSNNGKKWNDMSIGNGQSWPLFEYTGSTSIVWGYYDNDGNEVLIDNPGTGSLDVSPTQTTTYFVKVTTNDVVCKTEKTITVNPNPTAITIPDYEFCDNTDDDDGNNGSITLTKADFDALIPSILGQDQSENDYTVTFYTLSEDASTATNAITFPYTNPIKPSTEPHWFVNSTEIFIRVENNTTGCFISETSFKLIVKPKPIYFEVDNIILCDDNRDGRVGEFNLGNRTEELRSGNATTDPNDEDNQSINDFVVTYHTSLADANDLNSNGIDNPDNFTIEENNQQTIYFRIIKTSGSYPGCFITGEAFDLIVEALPFANTVTIARQCDGDSSLDTNSQDGIFPFDTSGIQDTLLNGQTDVTTYYYDKDDNFIGNVLPEIYETESQIITIKVENNTPQKCYDETTLEFIVDDSPESYEVIINSQCDDGVSDIDGYSEFNTSSVIQTLLTNPDSNQMQSLDDYSVSFSYVDENGSTQNSYQLPNPFNTKTQTVVATVTNIINTNCVITKDIDFTVVPLPVIKENLIKIEQCDDGKGAENDGVTLHDLSESQLLFSDNYQNETFEYYKDLDLLTKIDDPENYENSPFNDEVWIKITTEDGCIRTSKTQSGADRLKIEITVGASKISDTFMQDFSTFYNICDDSPANDQDGISVFSSTILKEIKGKLISSNIKFASQKIRVTLHTNPEDGLTGQNPIDIDQDFTNINPNTQEIWARIVNIDITQFTCLGYAQVAELYVEPRPVAYPVTILRQCDGDSPLDNDSQDGIYPFDTSNVVASLLTNPDTGVIQDQSILTITYYNEDGTEIPAANIASTFETASQTITIKVERNPSYPNITNPDGLCYDKTTIEFIVDDSPEAYPVAIAKHCDDGADDKDGYSEFDTSTILNTLLTNPTTGLSQNLIDYTVSFSYNDDKGVSQTTATLPNPFNTKTQSVIATVTNPLNLDCVITESIEFVVNPLPSFDIDDDTVVCLNPLPGQPVEIGTSNWNGGTTASIYNYYWTLDSDPSFNETTETIFVNTGGVYTVVVENPVTLCTREKSITVSESEMASLDLDDDGSITKSEYDHFIQVIDLANDNANTITINNVSDLGIGKYEFALDDAFGPYQDDPVFNDIKPGIHTLYIRDKNSYYIYDYGCGIASIDVSIIGYRKYFTPNGDGINDTWKILGIRKEFNGNSKVYIFDRHGKLLKELDPLSTGWDGTFNEKPMPATDYWFRTLLEDGREFKGHFSLIRGKFN